MILIADTKQKELRIHEMQKADRCSPQPFNATDMALVDALGPFSEKESLSELCCSKMPHA